MNEEENKRTREYFTPLYNFSRPMIIECCKEECSPFKTVEVARNERRYYISLHYIYSGKGKIYYRGGEIPVETGDLFIVPPVEGIRYEADKNNPFRYYWIVLAGQAAYDMMGELNLSADNVRVRFKGDRSAVTDLFGRINKSYLERPSADYERLGLFYLLFDKLKTGIFHEDDYNAGHYVNQIEILVGCSYMNSHFTVDDVCKNLNLSLSYINRIFKRDKKVSPKKYITRVRVKSACDYLVQTDKPVSEVARLCGFADPKYFARVFRENAGCTASEYREKYSRVNPKEEFTAEKVKPEVDLGVKNDYESDENE